LETLPPARPSCWPLRPSIVGLRDGRRTWGWRSPGRIQSEEGRSTDWPNLSLTCNSLEELETEIATQNAWHWLQIDVPETDDQRPQKLDQGPSGHTPRTGGHKEFGRRKA